MTDTANRALGMRRWIAATYFWIGALAASVALASSLEPTAAEMLIAAFVWSSLATCGYLLSLLLQYPVPSRHRHRLPWISAALGIISVPSMVVSARFIWGAIPAAYRFTPAVELTCAIAIGILVPAIISSLLLKCTHWLGWLPPVPSYPACCTCGYNLTGNVSGICPECGSPTPLTGEEDHQQPTRRWW